MGPSCRPDCWYRALDHLSRSRLCCDGRDGTQRILSIAFALLTPFFFFKAGTLVSVPAEFASLLLSIVLLAVKVGMKFLGVWPLTRLFHMSPREGNYTTLLMSTGLTFGSISALYGLTHQIINQSQYTILVTVVIGSAVIPTFIAQMWFLPKRRFRSLLPMNQSSRKTLKKSRFSNESLGEWDTTLVQRAKIGCGRSE